MATARLDELKARFDENPRRYFAPYANELRKHGDFHQAIAICRTHLVAQPAHVSGHIVLAQALHEAGEIDDARTAFEAALGIDPENLIALRYMGDIARERGEIETAKSWYTRVLEADPRNEEIATLLRTLSAPPSDSPPPAVPVAPPLMMGLEYAPPSAPHEPAPAPSAPAPSPAPSVKDEFEQPAAAPNEPRVVESAPSAPGPEAATPPMAQSEAVQAPAPSPSEDEVPPPVIDVYAPAEEYTADIPEDVIGYDSSWERELESSLDTSAQSSDDLWVPKPTPAADLSDYEAAPDPFIEDQLLDDEALTSQQASPADNGTPAPELDSWFDEEALTTPESHAPAHDRVDAGEPSAEQAAPPASSHSEPAPETPAGSAADWAAAPSPTPQGALSESDRPAEMPFVTETLAELYVQQGFRDEALTIYRQLVASDPTNEALKRRLEELEGAGPAASAAKSAAPMETARAGVSVRVFFGRLARRKPARSAGSDGAGSHGGTSAQAQAPERSTDRPEDVRAAPASEERREPSALSELFAAAKPSSADASAASTLASAFTDPPGQSAPSGRPTRMAERELSLDHLFREAPRSPSEPTTLDDFYANPQSSGAAPTRDGASADDGSDDLQQFTAWLEGLRKK
ncbi:MAG TPA: tetratricopeptide repeat protein [Gemmatimonadaceae bacterium]